MKMPILTVLMVGAFAVFTAAASAATAVPTQLTMTVPSSVEMGEDIVIEAHLLTADGHPVAGARLVLYQVGAVGERMMAEATTDSRGVASFVYREYTIAALSLKVSFAGGASYGPSHAEAEVAIGGVEVKPAVVMSHTPGPVTKGILFGVLGSVWLTYLFAAFRVVRIAHEKAR